jgi:hypothetical protein
LLSLRKQNPLFDFHGSLVIEERTVNPNQGPHKKWTEHFNKSHFLKLQLTGAQDQVLSNEGSTFILNSLEMGHFLPNY